MVLLIALCVCVFVGASAQTVINTVRVNTPQGAIVGREETVEGFPGLNVHVYRGIPYVQAPVGELRLKPPQPPPGFQELNATAYKPSCPQKREELDKKFGGNIKDVGLDEDCLYLNVWKPAGAQDPLPVMVWIHGGGFKAGSGSRYDSRYLVTMGNVIVVTFNYRLGVLGFLPTGGTEGTLGLQDQVMALKWVSMVISQFGGDPKRVTVFGQSAGAASVSLLTKSPKAKGLFQKAIMQSGVDSSPWATVHPDQSGQKMEEIKDFFQNHGCYQSVMQCMKNASTDDLVTLTEKLALVPPMPDDEYVPKDWHKVEHTHQGLEVMVGSNNQEAAYFINAMCTGWYTKPCDQYEGFSLELFMAPYLGLNMDQEDVRRLIKQYNEWYPMPAANEMNANSLAASYLISDHQIHVPVNVTAHDLAVAGHSVYVYLFDIIGKERMYPQTPWSEEAHHGDEIPFVFAWRNGNTSAEEMNQQKEIVTLWTDFAAGDPFMNWLPFTSQFGEFLRITKTIPQGESWEPFLPKPRSHFWNHYFTYGTFPDTTVHVGRGHSIKPFAALVAILVILQCLK